MLENKTLIEHQLRGTGKTRYSKNMNTVWVFFA